MIRIIVQTAYNSLPRLVTVTAVGRHLCNCDIQPELVSGALEKSHARHDVVEDNLDSPAITGHDSDVRTVEVASKDVETHRVVGTRQ
jgi:hypothetical protein